MDLCEERERGDDTPPPKIQHGSPTKAKSPVQQERPAPPEPSCVSMKSKQSIDPPLTFRDRIHSTKQRVQKKPDQPEPSCVSMKSSQSIDSPLTFRDRIHSTKQRVQKKPDPSVPTSVSIVCEHSMGRPVSFKQRVRQEGSKIATGHNEAADLASIFMALEENIITFVRTELKKFQEVLSTDYPECLERQTKDENVVDAGEEEQRKNNRQALLKITLHFLRTIKQEELADSLQSRTLVAVCQNKLKSNLKGRFQCFFEGIAKAGNPTLLNEIYTELYMTEGGSRGVSDGHEFRQIETTPRKPPKRETMIKCEDIFQPIPGSNHQPIRTVITNGEAGIGKTVLTQKFTLDWAEGKANHNIQFTFPFTFRELNLLDGKTYSLVELLHLFFTEIKEAEITRFDKYKVVFIFDGLDECRLPLDFHKNEILTDVTKPASVDVLLTNLIRGKLLPSARLWITTRPAAANQVPPECVDIVTEVRGFTDTQKKEYFEKRFRDEEQASSIISHIKTSRSLHIMCHIPVFCWITASVLEHVLRADENKELPKTLTEMYVHFLVVQSKVGNVKYHGGAETDPLWNTKIIMSLGKLAFEHLQKGNLIFYESDLIECGIDIRAASVYSGVFTQIFKGLKDCGLYQDKVFCFVHLSIQEFLAALYVFVTFTNNRVNLLAEPRSISKRSPLLRDNSKKVNLYQTAVDKALQSPNGHLDLFLRFLVGLSLETNQTHLQELLTPSRSLQNYQEIVKYIQRKIRKNPAPERCINLFHCLNELNDHSLVEEIQQYLSSEGLSTDKLSPAQWSALVFILLSSEKDLEVFDLRKYSATEEGLLRLLQVVKASRISCLRDCKLSERSCEALASVLMYKSSNMRELDLSNNDLQDSGVWLLSAAVASPNCRLETLRLSGCNLSERSCEALATVLSSQTSNLRELDLSNNDLQDSGVRLLSAGVASPHCRLKTLRLSGCNLSERSSEALASVLSSQTSSLKELDLSNNDLQDSGVRLLSAGVANQHCRLKSLRLSRCLVTEEGCVSLASALSSNPSHLKELDLSYNHPGDSGVKLLSAGLEDPQWGLDTLCVDHGGRHRLKPFMYARKVTLDPNTANRMLRLSEDNRKVTEVKEEQPYPDNPERFHPRKQVLCREGLSSSCYWEVEWKGWVNVGMTYRGIKRKGEYDECCLGENNRSWGLFCSGTGYSACHNKRTTDIRGVLPSDCGKVAVYLDWPAGTLSFYGVSSDTLIHLHTFNCTFTEPLYPVFRFKLQSVPGSYVSLCQFEEIESVTV